MEARTNVDPTQLVKSLVTRGIVAGAMAAGAWFLWKTMIDAWMEEVNGGLV